MDCEEKYIYWESKATYDLETARAMLQTGRYTYVAFMAQQAIEKLVKGLYVLYVGQEPARTHNIWIIFRDIIETGHSDLISDELTTRRINEYKTFFSDLLFYYIAERYPDYKQQISSRVTESKAKEILTLAEEVFLWLHSLSQYKK